MSEFSAIQTLQPPQAVRAIAETLERAGHEVWCVGGAVRDALAGEPHLDWDFATSATPAQVQGLFRKTIPIGIDHGTVAVIDRHGTLHEITTFRRDVRTDGRHAVVEFGASLTEDLARRDFTINAIAYSPTRNEIRDPFGGREDLERRILRCVGEPGHRMREDWLRALRAMRFAGRFDLTIEPETWKAIVEASPFLPRLSAERVRQEIEKTMEQVPCPSRSFLLWRASGALHSLLPSVAAGDDVAVRAADWVARPEDTRRAERATLRKLVRLACLFSGPDPDVVRVTMRALRFSNRDVQALSHIAAARAAIEAGVHASLDVASRPRAVAIRRWVAASGRTDFPAVYRTLYARLRASGTPDAAPDAPFHARQLYRDGLRLAFRDPVAIADLAIDGDDLMRSGIPPGRRVGEILRGLLDLVLEDPTLNTRERLVQLAREREACRPAGST
ncbi:MAG: CCA-adding enzyme [Gemmatimonadaceae bacterium]|nr:CCA-adding enzyme [Gemmatimonadaceae bacterium]